MEKQTVFPELLWAGTEHSLLVAMEAHERVMGAVFGSSQPAAEEEVPYLLTVQGAIGIVQIRGSLVNRDSVWNRYLGVTSYADISRALVYAATKPEIKGILLDVDSGGGAVNGVADAGNLIATIDQKVKPVWTFSGGTMASAAYWLGSSSRKVFASQTSIVGSIGVIVTHMEYSKALKEAGIGATVMRAGKYKALVNPIEPLSEAAREQMEAQLDAAYGIFIEHVAKNRGVTVEVADKKMGQGREFFGKAAVAADLVDGIESFDAVFGRFSTKLLDSEQVTQNNTWKFPRASAMTRKALTETEIAALAAGAQIEANQSTETGTTEAAATETVAEGTDVTQSQAENATTETNSDVLAFVQTQLAASQAEVVDLKVKLTAAEQKVTAIEAAHRGLTTIAAQSLSNMRIALRLSPVDLSAMSAETLLAEHAAMTETFKKSFKAGGVAVGAKKDTSNEAAEQKANDPLRARRLAATQI